jgi:hypothetical protein
LMLWLVLQHMLRVIWKLTCAMLLFRRILVRMFLFLHHIFH